MKSENHIAKLVTGTKKKKSTSGKGGCTDSIFECGILKVIPTLENTNIYVPIFCLWAFRHLTNHGWDLSRANLSIKFSLSRAKRFKHVIMSSGSRPTFFHTQCEMPTASHVINML